MTTPDAQWLDVPARIPDLYVKHAAEAREIFDGSREMPIIVTKYGILVLDKEAALQPFVLARQGFNAAGKALGGPNALTTALLAGALTAGLGYGTGWVAERLMPEKYMRRGPLKRNLAIAGGLLGGLGAGYAYGKPMVVNHGVRGLLMKAPSDKPYPEPPKGWGDLPIDSFDDEGAKLLESAASDLNVKFVPDELYKKAFLNIAGTALPNFEKDEFNQMISRDPYTPMTIRAGTMGLIEAASQSKGGTNLISPLDIARMAVGMGSGAVSGLLVGRTLGALAGLTPEAQTGLQRAGIMAGLLTNIVPKAFGAA